VAVDGGQRAGDDGCPHRAVGRGEPARAGAPFHDAAAPQPPDLAGTRETGSLAADAGEDGAAASSGAHDRQDLERGRRFSHCSSPFPGTGWHAPVALTTARFRAVGTTPVCILTQWLLDDAASDAPGSWRPRGSARLLTLVSVIVLLGLVVAVLVQRAATSGDASAT